MIQKETEIPVGKYVFSQMDLIKVLNLKLWTFKATNVTSFTFKCSQQVFCLLRVACLST